MKLDCNVVPSLWVFKALSKKEQILKLFRDTSMKPNMDLWVSGGPWGLDISHHWPSSWASRLLKFYQKWFSRFLNINRIRCIVGENTSLQDPRAGLPLFKWSCKCGWWVQRVRRVSWRPMGRPLGEVSAGSRPSGGEKPFRLHTSVRVRRPKSSWSKKGRKDGLLKVGS